MAGGGMAAGGMAAAHARSSGPMGTGPMGTGPMGTGPMGSGASLDMLASLSSIPPDPLAGMLPSYHPLDGTLHAIGRQAAARLSRCWWYRVLSRDRA